MGLNILADEVLATILEHVHLDVVTLWMAGDRSLNARIARSCRAVRSNPDLEGMALRRWPRMLQNLSSLEVLSINAVEILEDFEDVIAQVQRLSPTLRELELCFFRATQILLVDPPRYDETTGLWRDVNRQFSSSIGSASRSSLRTAAKQATPIGPPNWSVADRFPRLVRLSLLPSSYISSYDTNSIFTRSNNEGFGIFPPTLQELIWYDLLAPGPRATFTDFSLLPRGLRSFSLGTHWDTVLDEEAATSLPPQLTHLEVAGVYDAKSLLALPRTLTSGSKMGWRTSHQPGEQLDTLRNIPPGAVSLLLPGIHDAASQLPAGTHWGSLLPRSLTELSIQNHAFTSTDISLLPRTLAEFVDLKLDINDLSTFKDTDGQEALHKLWPPNLEFINFTHDHGISSPNLLCLLPPTLTHITELAASGDPNPLASVLNALGDHFPRLGWFECIHAGLEDRVKLSKPLPSTLKGLSLSVTKLSTSKHARLHQGLEHLILQGLEIKGRKGTRKLTRLPSTIKILTVESFDRSVLAYVPPSITQLTADFFPGDNPIGWKKPLHLRIVGLKEWF